MNTLPIRPVSGGDLPQWAYRALDLQWGHACEAMRKAEKLPASRDFWWGVAGDAVWRAHGLLAAAGPFATLLFCRVAVDRPRRDRHGYVEQALLGFLRELGDVEERIAA